MHLVLVNDWFAESWGNNKSVLRIITKQTWSIGLRSSEITQHKQRCIRALRQATRHSGKCSCLSRCHSPHPEMMNSAVYRAHGKNGSGVREREGGGYGKKVCVCVCDEICEAESCLEDAGSPSHLQRTSKSRRHETAVTPRQNASRFSSSVTTIYFTLSIFLSHTIILSRAGEKKRTFISS